jgi:GTP cyclohydrolase I
MAVVDSTAQVLARSVTVREIARRGIGALLRTVPCAEDVTEDTPERFVRAFEEMTAGYALNPADILARRFPAPAEDLVILKDIEFTSLCEHHLMPFSGHAHVAYLPHRTVVGISKLARLVDCYARRLQMQERLCSEVAQALIEHVSELGAACVIEASHGCLSCRGARKQSSTFITSAMLGAFRTDPQLRGEFFSAIQLTHTRV